MELSRVKRYQDKIELILERHGVITEWIEEYRADDFIADVKTKLATYKAFQEVVESCMDILAMACRDEKIVPKDDYTNIENFNVIDERMKMVLTEANGLRNRLLHRYNQSDDVLAFESMLELLPRLEEFVEVVERWMQKMLR